MNIQVKKNGKMTGISLVKPPSNIFDLKLIGEFSDAMDQVFDSPLVVISSSLNHFSYGVDVKIHTPELSASMLKSFHEMVRKLYHHKGITVCILHGYALGGAMELALACDFIFAHHKTKLGFPEIQLACFPPVASVLLPRKVGGKASSYLFTGEIIDGTEAEELGMIEGVFTEEADSLLETIRQHSLTSMSLLKKVLRRTSGFDFDRELAKAEEIYLNDLVKTPDMSEGIAAFLEKRKPKYSEM